MDIRSMAETALKSASSAAAQVRQLAAMLKRGEELSVQRFNELEKLLAGKAPTYADRVLAGAEHVIPFYYVIPIQFAGGVTTRTPGTVQIDQDGYFLADRYYACWRPTAGANAGEWKPVSSGILAGDEALAAANIADKIDFQWEIVEGSSQRGRQNNPIPGDILYRMDGDGKLTEPDVYPPGTTMTVVITPTENTDNAGTFVFVAQGRQCLNVVEAG